MSATQSSEFNFRARQAALQIGVTLVVLAWVPGTVTKAVVLLSLWALLFLPLAFFGLGVWFTLQRRARLLAGAAGVVQAATKVDFAVPAGACDCHTHIFGDPKRFPFFAGRSYTPQPALPSIG